MREWKYRHETASKGRGWKMQEWKHRHDSAGGGNCRSKNAGGNLVQDGGFQPSWIFGIQ